MLPLVGTCSSHFSDSHTLHIPDQWQTMNPGELDDTKLQVTKTAHHEEGHRNVTVGSNLPGKKVSPKSGLD